ncbi:MAG: hypothetical protein H8E42_11095 [Nitrospinae bacterium]|nr:hypothetical protein [Nitrospinota bacterium]MBL7021091.1 hypothetical protein [Nitrospinaceae bacterium]
MKNIKRLILFALFGMLSFAQTASGQTQADDTRESTRLAVSPYAQAVPNDSYTFMGISHPSLNSALTQIGVVVEVIGMTTTVNNAAGRAQIFTVDAGETHRIFVVNQSHSTINGSNSSFTDTRTHLIPTADSAQFGSVRVTTVSQAPTTGTLVGSTYKYENLAQLNIWGVVYVESGGTGFAMEFVGDMQDSTVGGDLTNGASVVSGTTAAGRGIN